MTTEIVQPDNLVTQFWESPPRCNLIIYTLARYHYLSLDIEVSIESCWESSRLPCIPENTRSLWHMNYTRAVR